MGPLVSHHVFDCCRSAQRSDQVSASNPVVPKSVRTQAMGWCVTGSNPGRRLNRPAVIFSGSSVRFHRPTARTPDCRSGDRSSILLGTARYHAGATHRPVDGAGRNPAGRWFNSTRRVHSARRRKRPTCHGRPFPIRVASIGVMHLTFNQGIKARLLGDPLLLGERQQAAPPTNGPTALPPLRRRAGWLVQNLARKWPTCRAQTLPARPSSSGMQA